MQETATAKIPHHNILPYFFVKPVQMLCKEYLSYKGDSLTSSLICFFFRLKMLLVFFGRPTLFFSNNTSFEENRSCTN